MNNQLTEGTLPADLLSRNPIKVAIVILNWNGSGMLRDFLPSVIRYSQMDGVEIYVADNGSTDDSLAVLKNSYPEVHRIILDENYGFAEGYNRALKGLHSQYYVLLNSDVEVTEDWLIPLIGYMDTHPGVAACQPKIRSWHNRDYFEYAGACGGFIDQYGYPFCRGRIMATVEKDSGQYDTVLPVFWATGAALFIRSADYWQVGGLDGRFFAHMEEIDLCWRLINENKISVCIPQSTVYHVGGATLKKENPRKTFLNFRNNLVMLYKNLHPDELVHRMVIRGFLDYMAMVSFLLKGDLPNTKAVLKAWKAFKGMKAELKAGKNDNVHRKRLKDIPGVMKSSILVQYYLKGKRRFKDLSIWKK